MKTKKIGMSMLLVFMAVMLASVALATDHFTATITNPETNTQHINGSSAPFNFTVINTTADKYFYNISLVGWNDAVATEVVIFANDTHNASAGAASNWKTFEFDSTVLQDNAITSVKLYLYNGSRDAANLVETSATISNLTVNNTVPTCSISTPSTDGKENPVFTATVTGGNFSEAYVLVNNQRYNMVAPTNKGSTTGQTTTYGFNSQIPEGQYDFTVWVYDEGGDLGTCSVTNVLIDDDLPATKKALIDGDITIGDSDGDSSKLLIVLGAGVAIWFFFLRKKK